MTTDGSTLSVNSPVLKSVCLRISKTSRAYREATAFDGTHAEASKIQHAIGDIFNRGTNSFNRASTLVDPGKVGQVLVWSALSHACRKVGQSGQLSNSVRFGDASIADRVAINDHDWIRSFCDSRVDVGNHGILIRLVIWWE